MENYTKGTLADVSWRDMLAQDPYFGLANSFQYSENINCDDELHGIKLSQRVMEKDSCANCQLISAGNRIFAVPVEKESSGNVYYLDKSPDHNDEDDLDLTRFPWNVHTVSGAIDSWATKMGESVIFQDYLWISYTVGGRSTFSRINVAASTPSATQITGIYDHVEDSDESITDINTKNGYMGPDIFQVINFNNTRLVCGCGEELRVYYPELDMTWETMYDKSTQQPRTVVFGETWWKRVQRFEAWCNIVGLTCDFEYLKVWVTDEWWNTKMYYYPGNNDLRNTFVYNLIDMTGTKVLRTYNINGIDYFTASLDWTDWYITFNKVIGDTPVQIFKQRGWLTQYDTNQKAWYFVGPTTRDAWYQDGNFYVGDAFGVFKFAFNPQGYDTWYLKWKMREHKQAAPGTVGLCVAWNFVFVSDQDGIKAMRLYDTGVDWYQNRWLLVSREMEWDYGGCVAKIIDELRCHYEFNNLKDSQGDYLLSVADLGEIDVYLSPNNLRQHADPEIDPTGWYHVMHLDGTSRETRYEKIGKFSQLQIGEDAQWNPIYWNPVFEFDRETITYCIVIREWHRLAQWTPIVREVSLRYHLKGKANEVYELNNWDNG